jgi:hypothetical protein
VLIVDPVAVVARFDGLWFTPTNVSEDGWAYGLPLK